MHILVLCHYYPPEVNAPASRTAEHAKVWAALGHQVTVITCAPNHPHGKVYPGYKNRLFQSEMVDGVRVVRVWSLLAANEGLVRRIANYVSYMLFALFAILRVNRPDIILTTSPQFFCGLAGFGARWMRRKPWVLEIRDLWPESIVTVGAMKKGRAIRFLEWLERTAYRRADHVVAVSDGFIDHIATRRGRNDVTVIKNGVDLNRFSVRTVATATKARFGLEGRFVAAYVGTHGMAHGLDTILQAAAQLRDDPRIGFLMVGDGAERANLEARRAAMSLDNVHIAGQLPKADMPDVWSATDASLILLKKGDTFLSVLPSKMFEAMAMQCPIILGVEGQARMLLDAAGAGIAIEPQNADDLAAALRRLVDNPETAARFGSQGRDHVVRHYDRRHLAQRYLHLFESLVV